MAVSPHPCRSDAHTPANGAPTGRPYQPNGPAWARRQGLTASTGGFRRQPVDLLPAIAWKDGPPPGPTAHGRQKNPLPGPSQLRRPPGSRPAGRRLARHRHQGNPGTPQACLRPGGRYPPRPCKRSRLIILKRCSNHHPHYFDSMRRAGHRGLCWPGHREQALKAYREYVRALGDLPNGCRRSSGAIGSWPPSGSYCVIPAAGS